MMIRIMIQNKQKEGDGILNIVAQLRTQQRSVRLLSLAAALHFLVGVTAEKKKAHMMI